MTRRVVVLLPVELVEPLAGLGDGLPLGLGLALDLGALEEDLPHHRFEVGDQLRAGGVADPVVAGDLVALALQVLVSRVRVGPEQLPGAADRGVHEHAVALLLDLPPLGRVLEYVLRGLRVVSQDRRGLRLILERVLDYLAGDRVRHPP